MEEAVDVGQGLGANQLLPTLSEGQIPADIPVEYPEYYSLSWTPIVKRFDPILSNSTCQEVKKVLVEIIVLKKEPKFEFTY